MQATENTPKEHKDKSYPYFAYMPAKILDVRRAFEGSFSSRSDVDEFNPKQIAPTLAMKAPPPTELMKAPSRFKLDNENNTKSSK